MRTPAASPDVCGSRAHSASAGRSRDRAAEGDGMGDSTAAPAAQARGRGRRSRFRFRHGPAASAFDVGEARRALARIAHRSGSFPRARRARDGCGRGVPLEVPNPPAGQWRTPLALLTLSGSKRPVKRHAVHVERDGG